MKATLTRDAVDREIWHVHVQIGRQWLHSAAMVSDVVSALLGADWETIRDIEDEIPIRLAIAPEADE